MSSIAHYQDDCQGFFLDEDGIPPTFIRLVANGTDPEVAADIVDTIIQATRQERYGEDAEPLSMVLGWTYGPDTP